MRTSQPRRTHWASTRCTTSGALPTRSASVSADSGGADSEASPYRASRLSSHTASRVATGALASASCLRAATFLANSSCTSAVATAVLDAACSRSRRMSIGQARTSVSASTLTCSPASQNAGSPTRSPAERRSCTISRSPPGTYSRA